MKNLKRPINPIVMKNTLHGLTKREYFAGLVIQALISNSSLVIKIDSNNQEDLQVLSKASISIADDLLKQLQND